VTSAGEKQAIDVPISENVQLADRVWISRPEPVNLYGCTMGDCIESGKTPLTDGEAGLRIVRILEAAQRSIKAQGGRITL
jgi:hypothetical protein